MNTTQPVPPAVKIFPLTLLVITRNEAANIASCLDSVPFAGEKIVVDSGSTDATVAIAEAHGARVVRQKWLGFGAQRNFATTVASNDWILVLDADERLSPQLAAELQQGLPQLLASNAAGALLRRTAWFMGAPMRWYRPLAGEYIERLYHRGRARWTDARVHEALRLRGRTVRFSAPLLHRYTPTLAHRTLKDVGYAELKIEDWIERDRPPRLWEMPFVFGLTFLKDYILRLGFMDGWRGYAAAHLAAAYAAYKRLRYYEITVNPDSQEVAAQLLRRLRS